MAKACPLPKGFEEMYNEEILTHQDSPTCSKAGLRIIPQPWTKYLKKKTVVFKWNSEKGEKFSFFFKQVFR